MPVTVITLISIFSLPFYPLMSFIISKILPRFGLKVSNEPVNKIEFSFLKLPTRIRIDLVVISSPGHLVIFFRSAKTTDMHAK